MNLAQLIEANWPIVGVVLLLVLLLIIWLIGRATRSKSRDRRRPDVLDEGAAPAQRNQALIDAPPAAAVAAPVIVPTAAAGTFAGIAEVVAGGAQREVQAAQEPIAEAPQVGSAPAEGADDLRRIKGLGPKLVTTLQAIGITRYAQIAAWTEADLDDLDTKLGAFAGRPRRDAWVEQAQLLAEGDTAAYEARFGKL